MKTRDKAQWLGEAMLRGGEGMGTQISYLLTAMDEPLGRTVGNALELAEAIDVLHGQGSPDLINLVLDLATKVANARRAQLQKWLQDGSAWKKFSSLVEAQDGSDSVLEEIAAIYKTPITHEIRSDRAGKITAMDAEKIGRASFLLGGGRQQVDDKIDLAVGISDLKKIGESVQRDEPLMRVHARTNDALEQVLPLLKTAAVIQDETNARVLKQMSSVLDEVMARLNAPESPIQGIPRINEVSSHFEDLIRELLNKTPGLACDFPKTAAGGKQRSGYPDLELVDQLS